MSASQGTRASLFTPILIGGSIILLINFALRASFGVFQIPIAAEFDWPRAEFSMAIAIQNLAWGIGQPIFGALGERWGDRWSIIIGAFLYSAGLILTASRDHRRQVARIAPERRNVTFTLRQFIRLVQLDPIGLVAGQQRA